MAFERLHPDPADMTVALLAQLLALTANAHFKPPNGKRRYEPSDFLPQPFVSETEQDQARKWTETLTEMRANYAARRPN